MPDRISELEAENFTLKTRIIELTNSDNQNRRTFWLEGLKMFLGFLNPLVAAGGIYISYTLTNAKLEATNEKLEENKVDRLRIEEKVDAVKMAATEAALKTEEVKSAVDEAHKDLKEGMNR